ncbi:hypothetical protein N7523_004129 [Penicillium sp. IBT 18751x]|nr:hypothetical protein N7523_004129 [Penicillium sp. IBT 18751x]
MDQMWQKLSRVYADNFLSQTRGQSKIVVWTCANCPPVETFHEQVLRSTNKRFPPLIGVYLIKVVNGHTPFQYCQAVEIKLFGGKLPEKFNERLEWDWLKFLEMAFKTCLLITYCHSLELTGAEVETGLWSRVRLLQWTARLPTWLTRKIHAQD